MPTVINASRTITMRDYHVHTCHSDGAYRPSVVVKYASERGVKELSITDHDSIKGLSEAARASEKWNIRLLTGIEMTTFFAHNENDKPRMLHVLGYGFDPGAVYGDRDLRKKLAMIQHLREDYYRDICAATIENPFIFRPKGGKQFSISLRFGEVMSEMEVGVPGDEHLAMAFRKKIKEKIPKLSIKPEEVLETFFFQDRKSWAVFEKRTGMQLKSSPKVRESFLNHTIRKDRHYYYTGEAIKKIVDIGGVPVLAHPGDFRFGLRDEEEIDHVISLGIRGLEVYHSLNGENWIRTLLERARVEGLAVTGGSDFHKGNIGGKHIGDFRRGQPVECDSIDEILSRRPRVR